MKKAIVGLAVAAAGLVGAASAQAATFTINFCPGGNGCPTGVSEASLTFVEDTLTADLNDYTLTLRIVGDATSPKYIDTVQFKIDSAQVQAGYEQKPTLDSAPPNGAPWVVYWDQLSNSPTDCTSNTEQGQGVCAQSAPGGAGANAAGALTNGTNEWVFLVDLADNVAPLGVGSAVNLRAVFSNDPCSVLAHGPGAGTLSCQNAGILSPGGGGLKTTTDTTTTDTTTTDTTTTTTTTTTDTPTTNTTDTPTSTGPTSTPEPALLSMLGVGLAGAAYRLRRRS